MSCPAVVRVTVPGGPAVVQVATPGPPGPRKTEFIAETVQAVNQDVSLSAGYNGFSVGSVEVAAGASVTVPASAIWLIAA